MPAPAFCDGVGTGAAGPPPPPPATNGCGEGEDGGGICLSKPPRCSFPTVPTRHTFRLEFGPQWKRGSRRGAGLGGGRCPGPAAAWRCPQHHPCQDEKTSEHRLCPFPSSLWIHDSTGEEPQGLRSDSKHQGKTLLDEMAKVKLKSKSI